MTPNQNLGYISELTARAHYANAGHCILSPDVDLPFDFIALADGDYKRVQVKTAYSRRGRLEAAVCSEVRRKQPLDEQYDYLMVVHKDRLWEIPADAISQQSSFSLNTFQEFEIEH